MLGYLDLMNEDINKICSMVGQNPIILKGAIDIGAIPEEELDLLRAHGTADAQALADGGELSSDQVLAALKTHMGGVMALLKVNESIRLLREELANLNGETEKNLHKTAEFAAEVMLCDI